MLGQILVQAGEVQEGLEMLVRALTVYHEKLGPQHPHTQRLAKLLSSFMGGQDSDEGSQSLTE
jgi:hypothetical protein